MIARHLIAASLIALTLPACQGSAVSPIVQATSPATPTEVPSDTARPTVPSTAPPSPTRVEPTTPAQPEVLIPEPSTCFDCIAFVIRAEGNDEILLRRGSYPDDRMTHHPATDTDPALSPTGRFIAFASNRYGSYDLFVMDSDRTSIQPLTGGPSDDREPAWSPDGSRLAFRSDRDGDNEILVLNLTDGSLTQLTNNLVDDLAPAWSADGQWIAFMEWNQGSFDIFAVQPDGSQLVPVACGTSNEGFPAWSPDRLRIAYQSDLDGTADIFVGDFDGPGHKCAQFQPGRLTRNPADDMSPTWSGDRIYFMTSRDGVFDITSLSDPQIAPEEEAEAAENRWGLYGVFVGFPSASSVSEIDLLESIGIPAPKVELLATVDDCPSYADWSENAGQLAYTDYVGGDILKEQVYLLDLESNEEIALNDLLEEQFIQSYEPAWSPDGERLAFLAMEHEDDVSLFLAELVPKQISLLYDVRKSGFIRDARDITWSPTGDELSLTVYNASVNYTLVRIAIPSGEILGTTQVSTQIPRYSPDGTRLAYPVRVDGTLQLQVKNLQTGVIRIARQWDGVDYATNISELAWSTDGRRLAYHKYRAEDVPGGGTIYFQEFATVLADGGGFQLITEVNYMDNPIWLHNGEFLLYEQGGIWIVRADSTDHLQLANLSELDEIKLLMLSRDGRRLLFTAGTIGEEWGVYQLTIPDQYLDPSTVLPLNSE